MDYLEIERKLGAKNYNPLDVFLNRGQGVWVWDVDGNRYMDCLSAYSAVNQGHCHPVIVKALTEQAGKLSLTSRAFRNDQLSYFYKELCELTHSHKVLPMNSGAEAVETAIKIVRKWGYQNKGIAKNKAEIIVCDNNFHGRTITLVSFSSDQGARDGFGPFTPGFQSIPFGDANCLENALSENTIAFMVEPIQGEAGVIIPPDGYLNDVRRICDNHHIVLILDEIQTGLGRTGKLLAEEHEGIESDITLIGKALSGGLYPVSAVLSNTEIMDVLNPGDHGSTFGGNPLACAVSRAALKVLIEEKMIENAAAMGEYFLNGLRTLKNPSIKEIRGRGLMIALEFFLEKTDVKAYCQRLKDNGLLCKETHENTIRLAPPLVATKEDIDYALKIIFKVIG